MNHAIFVVKIIEKPIHLICKEYQSMEIKVKFPAPRQKDSINKLTLLIWGNYKSDFINYYKAQDYLIIEGILTSQSSVNEVKVIVKKLYPFLLL
uniref:Single-stranded DNA binding protein n=1 Tax=Costaria costata TaxID=2872 RepID=A0A0S0FBJ8_COSCS|nr:hypothetical protein MOGBL162 [Costaria costata]ALF63025.1 hypothetical protein MOGBL162 [Costaria costata]QWK43900.1 hypothetical protein [Costaria costata]WAM62544.1 hypothetical protein [Costaria costata]